VIGIVDRHHVTDPWSGRRLSEAVSQKTCHCDSLFLFSRKNEKTDTHDHHAVLLLPGLWAQRDSILLGGVEVLGVASGNNVQSTVPRQEVSRDACADGHLHHRGCPQACVGHHVRDYGGAGGMKTVSVRGIGAKHTAVVYDGVALSDCQTGEVDLSRYRLANMRSLMLTVGDGDNIFVPARNVSSASVLEMSTDIGAGMAQGRELRVGLSAGSWGTVEPSLFWRMPLGRRLTLSLQGNYIYTEGNYPFTLTNVDLVTREHRQNSRMSSGHGELNLAWHPARDRPSPSRPTTTTMPTACPASYTSILRTTTSGCTTATPSGRWGTSDSSASACR
jgi:hypothetical protein